MSAGEREGGESFVQYCTGCGQMLRLRPSMAGKRVTCPGCKAPVVVQGITATPPEDIPTLLPADSPRGSTEDDYDAQGPRRRSREREPERGSQKILWISLGVVGAVVLVVVLILVTGGFGGGAAYKLSTNNLKQIGIAMHSYNDTFQHLPPQALFSPDGRPLLSWRVALLPFIEQENLYRQFRLDEPWDSPHNIRLLDMMPPTYADPKNPEKNATVYQVFVGQNQFGMNPIFHVDGRRKRGIQNILDGSSNTLMVVEGPRSVPWTKPEDIPYSGNGIPPTMAPRWGKKFLAVFGDGTIRELDAAMPPMKLNALITADGGEVIAIEDDEPPRRRRPFE